MLLMDQDASMQRCGALFREGQTLEEGALRAHVTAHVTAPSHVCALSLMVSNSRRGAGDVCMKGVTVGPAPSSTHRLVTTHLLPASFTPDTSYSVPRKICFNNLKNMAFRVARF